MSTAVHCLKPAGDAHLVCESLLVSGSSGVLGTIFVGLYRCRGPLRPPAGLTPRVLDNFGCQLEVSSRETAASLTESMLMVTLRLDQLSPDGPMINLRLSASSHTVTESSFLPCSFLPPETTWALGVRLYNVCYWTNVTPFDEELILGLKGQRTNLCSFCFFHREYASERLIRSPFAHASCRI